MKPPLPLKSYHHVGNISGSYVQKVFLTHCIIMIRRFSAPISMLFLWSIITTDNVKLDILAELIKPSQSRLDQQKRHCEYMHKLVNTSRCVTAEPLINNPFCAWSFTGYFKTIYIKSKPPSLCKLVAVSLYIYSFCT